MRLVDANEAQLRRWDEAVERSVNGTLFHRLDFLAYHGDRFADCQRNLVLLDGEEPFAHLPMAVRDSNEGREAVSPFGASFGSFAFTAVPTYARSAEAVGALVEFLVAEGIERCRLTPPIACCAEQALDTFHFALLEAGFRSVNRDVSSVVPLPASGDVASSVTSRARSTAKKARTAGVEVVRKAPIGDFWPVMEAGYVSRGRQPTHTRDELELLEKTLSDRVFFDVATLAGAPVAGLAHFVVNERVDSSFYLCQDPAHASTQALSLLVLEALEHAAADGYRWFDFGTSTAAMVARPNVFLFKESFSRAGMFRETFEWTKEPGR
ncbi:MAG TPA: GNAT family N-acetyltransferase [Acidimicrobiales bacterium]|nr:GNAT family N-acetyltransferase [Acidimicrobiales bacterium]